MAVTHSAEAAGRAGHPRSTAPGERESGQGDRRVSGSTQARARGHTTQGMTNVQVKPGARTPPSGPSAHVREPGRERLDSTNSQSKDSSGERCGDLGDSSSQHCFRGGRARLARGWAHEGGGGGRSPRTGRALSAQRLQQPTGKGGVVSLKLTVRCHRGGRRKLRRSGCRTGWSLLGAGTAP